MTTTTILSRFLAHAPLSEHARLLEYSHTEVNWNIYNIGAPAFSINSQNTGFFFGYRRMHQKARLYSIYLYNVSHVLVYVNKLVKQATVVDGGRLSHLSVRY